MKINFGSMTREEIRDYVLVHREDDDAIEALINSQNPDAPKYPFPQTAEDLAAMQTILEDKLNS